MAHTARPFRVRTPIVVWAAAAVGLAVIGVGAQAILPSMFAISGRGDGVGFSLIPDELFAVAGVPVTNTLLSCWLATLLIVSLYLTARLLAAFGHLGLLTAFWRFVQGLVGPKIATPLFTIAGSAVLFILANAWIASLPFYGPVYLTASDGTSVPLLRGAGSDINMSLALARSAGILVQFFGVYSLGLTYVERFFRVRLLFKGRMIAGTADFLAGDIRTVPRSHPGSVVHFPTVRKPHRW
jgi:F0F1-type ATP synthase membrane subunit a